MIGRVYLLRNPFDGTVFYIGQTVYSLTERLRGHLSEKQKGVKSAVISDILNNGSLPIIEELEHSEYSQGSIELLNDREIFWIKHYNPIGNIMHRFSYAKTCEKCGAAFDAKVERAKYCSDICRALSNQKKRVKSDFNDSEKFKKQTHCAYCEKEMESKYRSKKFCSDKCRVYYGREKVKMKATKKVISVQEPNVEVKLKNENNYVKKEMPNGLSRISQMRWLRENN